MMIPKPALGPPERALLALLAGCPTGATEYNLVTRHKVKPVTIYNLVALGLVWPVQRKIRPPHNYQVLWVLINDAGRKALKAEALT
jgi:hypothetical protein